MHLVRVWPEYLNGKMHDLDSPDICSVTLHPSEIIKSWNKKIYCKGLRESKKERESKRERERKTERERESKGERQ